MSSIAGHSIALMEFIEEASQPEHRFCIVKHPTSSRLALNHASPRELGERVQL